MRRPVLVDHETVQRELDKALAIDFSGTPWPEIERRLALYSAKQAIAAARGELLRRVLLGVPLTVCGCTVGWAIGWAIGKAVLAWLT
jgi:hypothetical protein